MTTAMHAPSDAYTKHRVAYSKRAAVPARNGSLSSASRAARLCCGLALLLASAGPLSAAQDDGEAGGESASKGDAPLESNQAVAIVERVQPASAAEVALMDYLYAGQTIPLDKDAQLKIVYFEDCRAETIRGGKVRIGQAKSSVEGGTVEHETVECSQPKKVVTAGRNEAGATVERAGGEDAESGEGEVQVQRQSNQDYGQQLDGFEHGEHHIWEVQSNRPWFKWSESLEPDQSLTLTVVTAGKTPPRMMWSTRTKESKVRYPEHAPKLELGQHYRARLTLSGETVLQSFFIPQSEASDQANVAAQLVPIGR